MFESPSIRLALTALGLALNLCSSVAYAEEAVNPAAARALFSEGRKLSAAGKYSEACPKFEESLRLDRGIGTEFNLADCWAHLNRTASAWALFLNVAAEAKANGQQVREDLARTRAAALEPGLSRVLVEVQSPAAGLELRRDGAPVGSASWGLPVPVDPGAHRFEATAPGRKNWSTSVELNTPGLITVQVPPLHPIAPDRAVTSGAPATTTAPAASRREDAPTAPGGVQHTAAWVGAGFGVAAVAVGTLFAVRTKSKNDSAKAVCPNNRDCTQTEADRHASLISDAKSARLAAYVGFGVGGAALVAASILYLRAPPAPSLPREARWSVSPFLGAHAYGATFRGAW